jgi:hypothetical protein
VREAGNAPAVLVQAQVGPDRLRQAFIQFARPASLGRRVARRRLPIGRGTLRELAQHLPSCDFLALLLEVHIDRWVLRSFSLDLGDDSVDLRREAADEGEGVMPHHIS